jgi:hypothetical protein
MLRALFAVILVTLTVSPFTAPFSTCELAVVDAFHPLADSIGAAKVAQSTTAIPSSASRGVPVRNLEILYLRPAVFYSEIGGGPPLVLRL